MKVRSWFRGRTRSAVTLAVVAPVCAALAVFAPVPTATALSNPQFEKLTNAKEVTGVATLPDGTVRFAERAGTVIDVGSDGSTRRTVTRLKVPTNGQRGLVGLDVDRAGKTVISWVRADGRIVVGVLPTGRAKNPQPREVFVGPVTADVANGGHLLIEPDGNHVIVGFGDFKKGGRAGKFLRISLPSTASVKAKVEELGVGWNNPYAFDWRDGARTGGAIVVADNSPANDPEEVAELNGTKFGPLPAKMAPSAIAMLSGGAKPEGIICGYWSNELNLYRFVANKIEKLQTLADDCTTTVRLLPDRRLIYASETALMISKQPL
jgi:hypothetical protein